MEEGGEEGWKDASVPEPLLFAVARGRRCRVAAQNNRRRPPVLAPSRKPMHRVPSMVSQTGGGACAEAKAGAEAKARFRSLSGGPFVAGRGHAARPRRRIRGAYLGRVCVWADAARSLRRAAGLGSRRIFQPRDRKRTLRIRLRRPAGDALSLERLCVYGTTGITGRLRWAVVVVYSVYGLIPSSLQIAYACLLVCK